MIDSLENQQDTKILTVHQLNQYARILLEENFSQIWVKGELSNVALPRSGHIYFTLKDESAQIRCAMFKGSNRHLNFTPVDGMAVLLKASVSIYAERGDYQLIVTHLEKWGMGELQQAFEALKLKLQQEGLFDLTKKKTLPRFPQQIGVITSPTGAAIQDILSVLKRRYPIAQVTLFPTQVQGKAAAQDIVSAINLANQHPLDVIILARGGGSLEDLWCFNEEIVARSIFASMIPIVSGVGHETDFTIADFVADIRAPTPSVAAETVTPDSLEILQLFAHKERQLLHAIQRRLQYAALVLDKLEKQLIHPKQQLEQNHLRCLHLKQRLWQAMQQRCTQAKHALVPLTIYLQKNHPRQRVNLLKEDLAFFRQRISRSIKQQLQSQTQQLAAVSGALHTISPLATLNRGYAIVSDKENKQIICHAGQVQVGQEIHTQLAQGRLVSTVKEVSS